MIDIPNISIEIYRLDIYRLLTLLLADKQVANDSIFVKLGKDNFDNEFNHLLILVAVVTRQLLDLNSKLQDDICGNYWHNYPVENPTNPLKFKHACHMIIHAKDIVIKSPDYYFSENINNPPIPEQRELYFQDIITVIGQKKERAEIDLKQFIQYCIILSSEIKKGD